MPLPLICDKAELVSHSPLRGGEGGKGEDAVSEAGLGGAALSQCGEVDT